MKLLLDISGLAFWLAWISLLAIYLRRSGLRAALRHPVGRILIAVLVNIILISTVRQLVLVFGPSFRGIDLYRAVLFIEGAALAVWLGAAFRRAPTTMPPPRPPVADEAAPPLARERVPRRVR